ncbi:hypothetical protein J4476_05275 [Candidatus Woesearchaeota archaeon]|nr:hypothetical protein [Candidatus Woesearchaeota archaeon]HIH26022.1 hypothetical protein [Nanoarchaeota archaeon]
MALEQALERLEKVVEKGLKRVFDSAEARFEKIYQHYDDTLSRASEQLRQDILMMQYCERMQMEEGKRKYRDQRTAEDYPFYHSVYNGELDGGI